MSTKLAKAMSEYLVTDEGKQHFKRVYDEEYNDWYTEYLAGSGLCDRWGNIYKGANREEVAECRYTARRRAIGWALGAIMDYVGADWNNWPGDSEESFGDFPLRSVMRTRNAGYLAKRLDDELGEPLEYLSTTM